MENGFVPSFLCLPRHSIATAGCSKSVLTRVHSVFVPYRGTSPRQAVVKNGLFPCQACFLSRILNNWRSSLMVPIEGLKNSE
jgi:hypothetical protein